MASNLLAMASTLVAMASSHVLSVWLEKQTLRKHSKSLHPTQEQFSWRSKNENLAASNLFKSHCYSALFNDGRKDSKGPDRGTKSTSRWPSSREAACANGLSSWDHEAKQIETYLFLSLSLVASQKDFFQSVQEARAKQ